MKYFKLLLFCTIVLPNYLFSNTSNIKIESKKPKSTLSQEKRWNLMIGKWYGKQPTKNNGIKEEIVERTPSGEYKITFRIYDNKGKYTEQIEVGYWGISGKVYFTIFKGWMKNSKFIQSDPSSPYNYDAYKIIEINDKIFKYENFDKSNSYIIKKVDKEFNFKDK